MAKRKQRSDPTTLASAPTKKQKREPPIRYECLTCGDARTEKQFPDYNPSAECQHTINTCKACLRKYVDIQIKDANTKTSDSADSHAAFGIECPECPAIMRAVNIDTATTKKTYAHFDKLERAHLANTTTGWRYCLSAGCDAGQVHESAPDNAANATGDAVSKVVDTICKCLKCGARACVPCDRPYHDGEMCAAYQLRIKDRVDEEDSALRAIKLLTQPCPNCDAPIQKLGGCTAMLCTSCGKGFMWK